MHRQGGVPFSLFVIGIVSVIARLMTTWCALANPGRLLSQSVGAL
jgi:hypothetical protein